MRECSAGVKRKGRSISCDRLIDAALCVEHGSKIVVRLGIIRLERDRIAIGGGGFLEPICIFQRGTEIVMRSSEIGLECDRLSISGDRLVELAVVEPRVAEFVEGNGPAGL